MTLRFGSILAVLLAACPPAAAQVPTLLSYQGRVLAGSVNFTGSGAFKFALVDGQTGDTLWSNDGTSVAGSEPASAVVLTVERGNFDVLLGQTQIANMTQPLPPSALASGRARLRVCFNDGINGSQRLVPDTRLAATGYAQRAATLEDGAVRAASLAAGAVTAPALAAGSVTSAAFSAGSVGAAQLAAGAVGSAQLAAGAVGAGQLAGGAVTANLAASGLTAVPAGGIVLSDTRDNAALAAAGFVRLGPVQLEADGWTQLRSGPFSNYDALVSGIEEASIVWTGREVIRWGGTANGNVTYAPSGTRYDPRRDVARTTTLRDAPRPRRGHNAIWTGAEMIVHGGESPGPGGVSYAPGKRYDPALDRWTPLSQVGDPGSRTGASAVWTGSEMIVWGGQGPLGMQTTLLNSGARYHPASDTWTAMTQVNAAEARRDHAAVWTGTEMLIWGAIAGTHPTRGSRYHPPTDSWTHFTTTGAPTARIGHGLNWTGAHLLVWGGWSYVGGGTSGTEVPEVSGGRYDPATDTWQPVQTSGAPSGAVRPGIVWTGTRLLAFGGANAAAAYDPQADVWAPLSSGLALPSIFAPSQWFSRLRTIWTGTEWYISAQESSGPTFLRYSLIRDQVEPVLAEPVSGNVVSDPFPQRYRHLSVWIGDELLVLSGLLPGTLQAPAPSFRYRPSTGLVAPIEIRPGASNLDAGCSALWAGSQVLIFGRFSSSGAILFARRYDPQTNTSAELNLTGCPAVRASHTAVWTGSEMIVFGGSLFPEGGMLYGDGARYSFSGDAWTALPNTGRPTARSHHRAVWTGQEMIVWGGAGAGGALGDGARFDPQTNTWTALPASGAPSPRSRHVMVWTGTHLLVWGGRDTNGGPLRDGAIYDRIADAWRPLPAAPAGLVASESPHHAWTGTEMLLFGGVGADGEPLNSGARFDPATDAWTLLDPRYAPPPRVASTLTWTGREWLFVGGQSVDATDDFFDPQYAFDDVHSYRPPRTSWLFQRP